MYKSELDHWEVERQFIYEDEPFVKHGACCHHRYLLSDRHIPIDWGWKDKKLATRQMHVRILIQMNKPFPVSYVLVLERKVQPFITDLNIFKRTVWNTVAQQ